MLVQFYYDLYTGERFYLGVKKTFEDSVQQREERERIGQVVVLLLILRGDYWLVYIGCRIRTEETSSKNHTDPRDKIQHLPTLQLRSADKHIVLNQDKFGLFPWRLNLRRGLYLP